MTILSGLGKIAGFAAPAREIGEYDMMVRFTDTVTDPWANELLSVALAGKGAFRRFKDALHRVGLGSDDETGTTSLYGADLYDDTFGKPDIGMAKRIRRAGNHGR